MKTYYDKSAFLLHWMGMATIILAWVLSLSILFTKDTPLFFIALPLYFEGIFLVGIRRLADEEE